MPSTFLTLNALIVMCIDSLEAIKSNPSMGESIPYMDPVKLRNSLPKVQYPPPPAGLQEYDISIVTRDGYQNPARVYKRATNGRASIPLIVLFHGGGYCLGDYTIETEHARAVVQAFDVIVISIGYRLAPENPFPTPIEDAWDGLKWASANAQSLGADLTAGFIVGGTSAGGSMSAVLAHLARDEQLSPPLTGQFLCITSGCPARLMPEKYKPWMLSHEQNASAPIFSSESLRMTAGAYKPVSPSPLFAALLNPNGHEDLPPAYFQCCGLDPLRDEGLIYEMALREEANVKTKLDMYPGLPHGFWTVWPHSEKSKKRLADAVNGFGWLLAK